MSFTMDQMRQARDAFAAAAAQCDELRNVSYAVGIRRGDQGFYLGISVDGQTAVVAKLVSDLGLGVPFEVNDEEKNSAQ